MSSNGYYIENTDKPWRSTANKQSRPDPTARAKNVIPRDRLVTKKGRYFTTDTSQEQREDEMKTTPEVQTTSTKFLPKNR